MSVRGAGVKVLTRMAWFELNQTSRLLELRSVHPGYTAEEVQATTGFDLRVTDTVPTTPPPTEAELQTLRTVLKDHMIETDTVCGACPHSDWHGAVKVLRRAR